MIRLNTIQGLSLRIKLALIASVGILLPLAAISPASAFTARKACAPSQFVDLGYASVCVWFEGSAIQTVRPFLEYYGANQPLSADGAIALYACDNSGAHCDTSPISANQSSLTGPYPYYDMTLTTSQKLFDSSHSYKACASLHDLSTNHYFSGCAGPVNG